MKFEGYIQYDREGPIDELAEICETFENNPSKTDEEYLKKLIGFAVRRHYFDANYSSDIEEYSYLDSKL